MAPKHTQIHVKFPAAPASSHGFAVTWNPLTHALSTTLPAALAMAEKSGGDGRDVALALVKGIELHGWIRHASKQTELGTTKNASDTRYLCSPVPPGTSFSGLDGSFNGLGGSAQRVERVVRRAGRVVQRIERIRQAG